MRIRLSCLFLLVAVLVQQAAALEPRINHPKNHPPRIIRACCMFGSKVGIVVFPFIKLTAVTDINRMGSHHYLGRASENNGIVYTRNGGFIDMGHMRDQADWTAYLYAMMKQMRQQNCIEMRLGHEGGAKKLCISIPPGLSDDDLLLLAGRIAYDLSLWHEIATWFGVSSVPLVSEQFSSFSVEDGYSNLLGVTLGMEAVKSNLPYDEAMTRIIRDKFTELGVVVSNEETLNAMEAVRDIWWTRKAHMPSNRVQIARQTVLYDTIHPMLIPDDGLTVRHPQALIAPSVTSSGDSLTDFYDLCIRMNYKFPVKKLFPGFKDRIITQKQYEVMLGEINRKLRTGFLVKSRTETTFLRKAERAEYRRQNRLKQQI